MQFNAVGPAVCGHQVAPCHTTPFWPVSLPLTHPPSLAIPCPQNWLYEEGEEETKSVYVAKLGEVKALGGPVEARAANAAALPAAADALRRTCQVRH